MSELCAGRWEAGREIWKSEQSPTSLHNLAVLEHALLLSQPDSAGLWKSTFNVWWTLASATNDPGYVRMATQMSGALEQWAVAAARRGQPEPIRLALSVLEVGWSAEKLEELEQGLLGDEMQRLLIACADIRKRLLEFALDSYTVEKVAGRMSTEVLTQAEFLSNAALPAGAIQYAARREVALLYRTLARTWRDLQRNDEQVAALEAACNWAPMDLREEIAPELDHVRGLIEPVAGISEAVEIVRPRPKMSKLALLGLTIALAVVGLYFATPRPNSLNLRQLPRQAIEKRISEILDDNADVVARIKELEAHDKESKELAQLRERNQKLLTELDQLEKARRGSH